MKKILVLFCFVLATQLSSCYRMPNEDEYSVIPTTNNPAVTNQKSAAMLPGVGY